MEVGLSIHQAKNLPEKYCNEVFAEYQWIDDRATIFSTEKVRPKKKDNNPSFKYSQIHDLKIDNYIVENLADLQCIISVYGKLTEDNIQGLYKDFSQRPETVNLLKDKSEFKSDAFYDAVLNRDKKPDVFNLEDEEKKLEEQENERKRKEEEERIKDEIKKELEKIQEQNNKLKKDIKLISKDKGSG